MYILISLLCYNIIRQSMQLFKTIIACFHVLLRLIFVCCL